MNLLNDGIHNCKKCDIVKKYKEPCSSQSAIKISSCRYCITRGCCISPFLVLMPCEDNTILDRIDNEDEYALGQHIVPFNRKTNYCKHMDTTAMKCKVYRQRPIACRIAGESCNTTFWKKAVKEQYKKLNKLFKEKT